MREEASEELLVGPIIGDLLGPDHLASRAREVARAQRLVEGTRSIRPARLLARLSDTRHILADAQERLIDAAADGVDTGPAAEWLLDNYHVVLEHLREVRESLPGGYYRELPELATGPLTGYPRVYEIAIALISHTEARISLENVDLFVEAFQSVAPLSVGELWAMPAMLRLGLIESIRRMTLRTVQRLDEIELAQKWVDRILAANARGGSDLRTILREFSEAEHALTPHFVSQFLQSLRQAEGASPALVWLEHWLRNAGVTPESAVSLSTQRLVLTQLMMANGITSLRDIGRRDWRTFVERQSVLEATLRKDPSGFYPQMTFATRDSYRHVVERIAKRTDHRESSVAQWAVDLARRHAEDRGAQEDPRLGHVGYYLLSDGLAELERLAGYRPTIRERIDRGIRNNPNAVFIGGLALCTILATGAVLLLIEPDARASLWLILLLAFLPALDISVTVLNQLVTTWLPPRTLPRIDLQELGVSEEYRTAVVIPTLFGSEADVDDALESIEVQFLANREAHLHFAILSDFTDAATETTPSDAAIVARAAEGVRALNALYEGSGAPFHLMHRPRVFNSQEGVWMGWERKRGKLADFNQLLRGGNHAAFSVIEGDCEPLLAVRYVITLDADTVLPPDAAPLLIGALAHPLNRAVYDEQRKRIVRGYGILQPRVGISLPSAHRSRFASISSGHPGVDPYSTAVSDVYQDLYSEGSFTGKGIYDVDAFQLATHGRFPENALLSHDLIEGNYARAGLSTDVIVYDDYPSSYVAYSRRKHRWIRGDWQLLPWLRFTVPGPDGPEPNRLSLLSRWKILDNMRRSLVEIAQFAFIVGAWMLLPGSLLRWTMLGIGAIIAPWVTALILALVRPPLDKSWRAYYSAVWQDAVISAQQASLAIVFLPHQALISADAIVRTLYRMAVSRKHLLEWQSASLVEQSVKDVAGATWRAMRGSVLLTLLVGVSVALVLYRRDAMLGLPTGASDGGGVLILSLLVAWVFAYRIAAALSRPSSPARTTLDAESRETAQRYAALHWKFFDTFVTAETHWLAPDNFQRDPDPVVALRTSPTNIGLQWLAIVSAHDLGLIGAEDMTERLERAFVTLSQMQRYRGHFYNWYDLRDLHLLEPRYISTVDSGNIAGHLIALRQACLQLAEANPALDGRLQAIATQAYLYAMEMDFTFLYVESQKLFTIGYHTDSQTPDVSCYDLLASEARLASFVAIAKDDAPLEHWFRLSRTLNRLSGSTALVSWSGSMFEYLMPLLVMRSLPDTLLSQTYETVVERQRAHGRSGNTPWGVSESAYNVRDRQHTYQYRAFGIADLALKRGLQRDHVIAPYATALAAMVDPPRAIGNLRRLEALGALGEYGFYDALDYTRPPTDAAFATVQTNMAHHIGMSLVAFDNVLRDDIWQTRFHADPLVQSAELLLHERIPRRLVLEEAQVPPIDTERRDGVYDRPIVREVPITPDRGPQIALLGALPYTVMLNHNGSGYSRYQSLAVTRWRHDSTADDLGQYCYVRDLSTGRVWSTTLQPTCTTADEHRTWLASDRVTVLRVDGDIETRTEITVVPADSAEVRRVTITNRGPTTRDIELTSYGEIVLGAAAADRAHPAFAKLFVETEWHAWCTAVTATRRPRSPDEERLWCVHVVDEGPDRVGDVSCETDRARFIGRGNSLRDPAAVHARGDLSGTVGAVLDPVFALRTILRVAPGQSASASFTTLVAPTREEAFELADRYHDSHAAQRAFDFTWATTQLELRELGITPANAAVFQDIATQLLYRGGTLAPPADEIRRNRGSQPRLWTYGISGDFPIVVASIDSINGLPTLREILAAHRYWGRRGLNADLVILNGSKHDYLQELRDSINEAIASTNDAAMVDKPGGVHLKRRDAFEPDDLLMVMATARVQITCDGRSLNRVLESAMDAVPDRTEPLARTGLARSIERVTPISLPIIADAPTEPERGGAITTFVRALKPLLPARSTPTSRRAVDQRSENAVREPLRFFNGIGGMGPRGDYHMQIGKATTPPAPWSNVVGNPHGGFLVSERGAGCTWAESAYFYRLTPWHNDPVSDPPSDVVYLRDLDSNELWSATPAPITDGEYRVRHGAGYSTFEHMHDAIGTVLRLGLADDAAVRLTRLTLSNDSARPRRIAVTAYAEWTLGARREDTQYHVATQFIAEDNAIMARNHFDQDFTTWRAFMAASEPVSSYSANRRSFLGQNGSLANPAALQQTTLDRVTGVGLDPCAALQMIITLKPGEQRDITIALGGAADEVAARALIARFSAPSTASESADRTVSEWTDRLSVITVKTPDDAFDAMLNKWLLYQAMSSRIWARTALYQSSGAYGLRDQLQDMMSCLYAEPAMARAHIVRSASRQFVEGDVQHWWHPHNGRGVRTRFSDDLIWLPYVVDQYTRVTGDLSVLDEYAPFLTMRALEPDEHEVYDLPTVTDEHASVYEHCLRALRKACTTGQHGLPLIGTGDWNDGMNRVGASMRGESVWLAWFLVTTLRDFARHADARGDGQVGDEFRAQADAYVAAVESAGWDGAWYRRAYYDDGTPMGSASNDECRIDSIAQSWSVISGAGMPERQTMAMQQFNDQLVLDNAKILMLLTPPFDKAEHDPGYIAGYLPGVRENGAQYTHAALWAVMATAMHGDGDRAFELYQMLNPLSHGGSADGVARYKVEPYVVAADVYTAASQLGRGGWTWYTGSAAWMYRVGLEEILGFTKRGDSLRIVPSVPSSWSVFSIEYRFGASVYRITVNTEGADDRASARVIVDGNELADDVLPLVDDGRQHEVTVYACARRPTLAAPTAATAAVAGGPTGAPRH